MRCPFSGRVGRWGTSLALPWEPGLPLVGAASCWDIQMWELQVWDIPGNSRCGTSLAFGAIAAHVSLLCLALLAVGAKPGPPGFGALKPRRGICGCSGEQGGFMLALKKIVVGTTVLAAWWEIARLGFILGGCRVLLWFPGSRRFGQIHHPFVSSGC